MTRILTALVLLSVLWPVTELGPAWAFALLVAGIVALATWECYGLLAAMGSRPFRVLGVAAALGVVWAAASASIEVAVPLAAVTVVTPILAMWTRPDTPRMVQDTVGTLFPVLFVGLTLSYVVRIRALPGAGGEDGRDLLYLLFVCVILADTAAFYVGTLIGKHRMAPSISPKKSWEGTLAGMLASVGGALLGHFWFYQRLPLGHAVVLGLAVGLAGVLGDLAESAFKRAAQTKDSSALLPGHGGVLDRTDSLLFSAPLLYHYYRWFLGSS